MRVIDLLNKIANNEEVPTKIKVNNREYLYDKYNKWYFYGKTTEDMFVSKDRLNDEVEIIEDNNKIEKIKVDENANNRQERVVMIDGKLTNMSHVDYELAKRINQIIDKLNEMEENK